MAVADQAGRELGFEVVKLGVTDAEKALTAIDNLNAQGVKGFVIYTPRSDSAPPSPPRRAPPG
ncbi:MAG: hypothetical protein U1F87_03605 [Kiritimatiellia bacterium]